MARIADPAGHEATALSRLVDFSGKNVIDIGCGIGRTVRHIAGTAASVLGVDPSEESIARARSSAGDEADRCTFMAADALRQARRWLRPRGLLINIQPRSDCMKLEVRLGVNRRPGVGLVFDSAEAQEDMNSSYGTLTALAAEGLFTHLAETVYTLAFHFDSEDDWLEFLARPKAGHVEADPDLLSSTLAHPDGSIVATEDTTITVYQRAS